MRYLSLLVLFALSVGAYSQVEIDASAVDTTTETERYIDYSDQLLIKVMSVVKQNNLELVNTSSSQYLLLSPANISSLGFGFNYKWLGLAVAFGLPAKSGEEDIYVKTTRFDGQLNVYSKKFVIDAFAQQYRGFYVKNPAQLTEWNETFFPKRDSMQTFSMGIGGYYVFNHDKFSYKAAYVRNAVQKKSAGSFLLGGFYNIDYAGFEDGAKHAFVPGYFPTEVQDTFDINSYSSRSYGITFGYTHTFVIFKRFFFNISLVPGLGSSDLVVYDKLKGRVVERKGAARFIGRTAFGYENKYFILGLTTYTTTGTLTYENLEIKPSTSNVKFFIARRFNVRKKQ
ncbi:MAG: DUF4421 family protein [Flavobacteriales bacterium]|nr:DUF4421 family protein [Flavobacteriales bacterium]